MNEQNPELTKIMRTTPNGLIISGIAWAIMCFSIIAGMYFIKYPHFTHIPVVYNGTRNSEHKNEFFFTIENTDVEMLQIPIKASHILIKINERQLSGVITNIFAQGKSKFITINIVDADMQKLPVGTKGQMVITISKKRMFELIPFLRG